MAHGVMFHHFHSQAHGPRLGSLSGEYFSQMLDFLDARFRIVGPDEFASLSASDGDSERTVVLTFDDALLSQVDVAVPILSERGYTGLFSIYSSVFGGEPDPLEIFASFRAQVFPDFSSFLDEFEGEASRSNRFDQRELPPSYPDGYLSDFPFYGAEERRFRYLRDEILGPSEYSAVMWSMIHAQPAFDVEAVKSQLWMNPSHLALLLSEGHSIGLHSHTHPTRIDELPREQQAREYRQNFDWIERNLGVKPRFVAHPCGRYSSATLEILSDLGIQVGFRSSMSGGVMGSPLEVPREDHANIVRLMRNI